VTLKTVFTGSARKTLRRLPADRRAQIIARIEATAAGEAPNIDVRPLAGSDLRRLRVGEYRVIFAVDPAVQVLTVELIRTRGDVYKR
jgi:mRNA interferase RelE/StbE